MAQSQKPHFVFRLNGRVHYNRGGASVQSTTGSRGLRISFSNGGYTMFRVSVKSTDLPTPFASFPFTSPPVYHRVPSHFNWSYYRLSRRLLVPGLGLNGLQKRKISCLHYPYKSKSHLECTVVTKETHCRRTGDCKFKLCGQYISVSVVHC